jgi:hypothetical protein
MGKYRGMIESEVTAESTGLSVTHGDPVGVSRALSASAWTVWVHLISLSDRV